VPCFCLRVVAFGGANCQSYDLSAVVFVRLCLLVLLHSLLHTLMGLIDPSSHGSREYHTLAVQFVSGYGRLPARVGVCHCLALVGGVVVTCVVKKERGIA
jgi:hypothetical protein